MRVRKYFIWLLFVGLLMFTRFYNLGVTARFTEDESKDLVGMHQVFVDRKLTLVGPTNEQGTKVFSSLTFYMLLPGAIIGKFDPVSPHYSAAFWGIVTAVLLVYLTWKLNPKFTVPIAALILVWFPLLETSRWAWNPNLVPLWIVLALIFIRFSSRYYKLFAGIFFGLAIHSHYYAIFAVGIFILIMAIHFIYRKKYSDALMLFSGFAISILPFLIFDLRHPPGIFLANLFSQSKSIGGSLDANLIFHKFITNVWGLMLEYTRTMLLAAIAATFSLTLILRDIKKRSFSLVYIAPWILQTIAIAFIPQFFPHYLIPGLVFFVVWVAYKRVGISSVLSYLILITLFTGGLLSVYPQLISPTSIPSIAVAGGIEKIIKKDILYGDLKNVNIAVLASPDQTTSGKKYRDLLLVDGNIHILTKDEYGLSDHLFVISVSDEKTVRSDPAAEMHRFRTGPLVGSDKISGSNWYIYHFTRGI